MKNLLLIHFLRKPGLLLLLFFGSLVNQTQAQTLGGIPDKTFNIADSGQAVFPLNKKNQRYYPGPNAGIYMTVYDNFRLNQYPGRHLQVQTGYFDKEGVATYQAMYANYYGNKYGEILEPSPRNFYTVQNWYAANNLYGNDTLAIARLTTGKIGPTIQANKFYFSKPLQGFYHTGLAQPSATRLAFWLTHNTDTLKPHNSTYVRLLDTSCVPLPAFNEIPGFRAEISTTYQGNVYLLGHNMNDTIPTTTRIVVLDGTTIQPLPISFPGLASNDFLVGKPQIFRILPGGKMQVAGFLFNGQFAVDQVIQLNTDGTPDAAFPLSFSSGSSGVHWSLDQGGTIRCASYRVVSGQSLAVFGVLQPAGGIQTTTFNIPNEYGLCHPLMFHPDYNAILFETSDLKATTLQNYNFSINTYYSDTIYGTRHRFYVNAAGQTWPLVNKAGVGMFGESIQIDVNPVANKFVAWGDFTQVNNQLMPNLAVMNADGTLDPTFKSSLNIYTDSIRQRLSLGFTQANITNSGKVLLSYGTQRYYSWVYGQKPYFDTIRRLSQTGLPDPSYAPVWHLGSLTRTKNGGFVSLRLYENGQPVVLPNTGFGATIKVVKFDAEGNVLGELGSYTSDGTFPDNTEPTNYRFRDIFCEDESGGIWAVNQFNLPITNDYRGYYVRFDPNGSTRIIYPDNYTFRSVPLKIEILAGKRMRMTGAFGMSDTTLNGKVVNVIETDSTGKMDMSVPTKVFFVPDAYGGRQKYYSCPMTYQSDGKLITLLKNILGDFGGIYMRLKANGTQDNSFMPIRGIFGINYPNYFGILGDRFLIGVTNFNGAGY